jgi:Winged helix domain
MTRAAALTIRIRIGDDDGPGVTVRGREAWALLALMAASERGCTPIDAPGPRWSGYVHDLRKLGVAIETVRERHAGRFPGDHARYVLRSRITVLDKLGAAL